MAKIKHYLKSIRNQFYLFFYCGLKPEYNAISPYSKSFRDNAIIATIAFEQPWVIDWLISMWKLTISDAILLVADNSKDKKIRKKIREICVKHNTPYIALPSNPTRHPNRSHAMAMQWVYQNIFLAYHPEIFGFIDHDLIPFRRQSIRKNLLNQSVYGHYRGGYVDSNGSRAWNLWAGYCLFKYSDTAAYKLNFLYDFSHNLDTGGMNYHRFYKNLNPNSLLFATSISEQCSIDGFEDQFIQIVGDGWYHVGSISYNDNLSKKRELVAAVQKNINAFLPFFTHPTSTEFSQ